MCVDPLRYKPTAARRILRSLNFDAVRLKRLFQMIMAPARQLPIPAISTNAWSMYLQEHETRTSAKFAGEIERRMRSGRTSRWTFAMRTSAATPLKLVGPLDVVSQLIPLEELSRQSPSPSPSQRGKGVYNLLWSWAYAGDIEAWKSLWSSEAMLSLLFDPNWAAWLRLVEADLACMLGDDYTASMALQTSETQFAARFKRHPLFLVEYEVSCARTDILTGARPVSPDWPLALLSRIATKPILNTPFRRASLQVTAASLLGRDAHREALKLLDCAEALTPSGLHRVLIGLLRRRHGTSAVKPAQLLEESRRLGFGYGEALILAELGLPATHARLSGAKQLLSSWSTGPTLWIVP